MADKRLGGGGGRLKGRCTYITWGGGRAHSRQVTVVCYFDNDPCSKITAFI